MSMPIMPAPAPKMPLQPPAVPAGGMPNPAPVVTPPASQPMPPMMPQAPSPGIAEEGDSVKFSACSKTLAAQPTFQGKESKKPLWLRLARMAALLG